MLVNKGFGLNLLEDRALVLLLINKFNKRLQIVDGLDSAVSRDT